MKKICTKCKQEKELKKFAIDKRAKDGRGSECKECINKRIAEYRLKFPWACTLMSIKQRCDNPKGTNYKNYGGRGIKCLITGEELKKLWFRDKAYLMKIPSIDRKDNDGNYVYANCRYLEKGLNTAERNTRVRSIPTLQYDLQGNFIKEYSSMTEASKINKIDPGSICICCQGKLKTSGGYIWKYRSNNVKM